MRKIIVYAILLFFLFNNFLLAYSSNPKDFINELVSDAIKNLSDKNLTIDQKASFVEKVALENVDINALGLYTLGELRNSSNENDMQFVIQESIKKFGKIDVAIHSAYPKSNKWGARFEELNPEYLYQDLTSHLGGAIIFSKLILKHFLNQGFGNLVHFSSIQGTSSPKFEHYEGTNMVSPIEYSAIKAGIISITKYLAKYYKNNNIRINCISPGGIFDNQPEIFLTKYREECNLKGLLNSDDI